MSRYGLIIFLLFYSLHAIAQRQLRGTVTDSATNLPIEGATVSLMATKNSVLTDEGGHFAINCGSDVAMLTVTMIGYTAQQFPLKTLTSNHNFALAARPLILEDVTIVANSNNPYKPISKTDIAMRGVSNSQEVLRIIPGIVIAQHQGGGKAEQIFLRGFDADHGTDFSLTVDGLPINMVSHAHGQGFADSHFIIPETIESVDFRKGPYDASKGDFATTGFVDFNTKTALATNTIKLEGGMFNTWRAMGMFNLLNEKLGQDAKGYDAGAHNSKFQRNQHWYVASEYRYSDSYFDNPQHFKRFNLFSKYSGKISPATLLTISASTFTSKWDASGQIPQRAVDAGLIGFYGAIDPLEGGITARTNVNVQLLTSLANGDLLKNQFYLSLSDFDLHTNFTFFLVDTANGDEIRQREARTLLGYNGSYRHAGSIGDASLLSQAGVNVRADFTHNSELSHTIDRFTTLERVKLGDISQVNLSPYLSETLAFSKRFSLNAAIRFDQFFHRYDNKLATDSTLPGVGKYRANAGTVSPKLNFYYHVNDYAQFYLATGKGFHSNDTRAVVGREGAAILPSAYSADLGTIFKPSGKMIINAAIWYIYLQQEFVYSGDGGFVDFSGKTRRYGFDFSGRYQPVKSLYLDVDLNYAHGRAAGAAEGQDYIPLAPIWTSTGGLTYTTQKGINANIRYRYISARPGNENYSLTAVGYFITDAVINYTRRQFQVALVINNVLNRKWKETQFDTNTRLKNEPVPVDEICFTAGTPFAATIGVSYFFK